MAVSRRRWRGSGESTSLVEDSEGDDDGMGASKVPAEAHQRDIRCLAASPAGDMVATG